MCGDVSQLHGSEILIGAPSGHHDWDSKFAGGNMSVAERGGKRISMFAAGLNNLSRKTLGDFDGLGEAAAFRHQSRNVRAGAQVPSPF
jgi:hypothetical protein